MKGNRNRRGSALVFALITSVILLAMVGAISVVAAGESNVVIGTRQLEEARLVTEAGLNLMLEDYQKDQAPPPTSWYTTPQDFAGGTFQIVSDISLGGAQQRRLVEVEGTLENANWGIEAVIGPVVKPLFDSAIQANSDIRLVNRSQADSYDSRVAPYDPMNPGDKGDIRGNGNLTMANNSSVLGDVEVTGTITADVSSTVSGTSTPSGDPVPLDSVDALVSQMVTDLSATNDNATINPTMVVIIDGEPFIQIPNNRTKVLRPGDYYLRGMATGRNSNLVFDTRSGPIRIVAHTDDVSLAFRSNFVVEGTHPVYIYMSGNNKFSMENLTSVINPAQRADLFQVVINSNDPGGPRFEMGQNTNFFGAVWAPEADVDMGQYSSVYGAIIGREVSMANYSRVHYDEALMDGQWILIPDSYRVYFKRRVL